MIYYFYKITNNINGKYYYGVHHTENINDGYMGSGVLLWRAYNKYGQENFTKEIVKYFNSSEEMYDYERQVVNEDEVKNKQCYNVSIGGGGNYLKSLSDEQMTEYRKKMSNTIKEKFNTPEYKEKFSELTRGEKNPMFGRHHSEESKKKMRDAKLGKKIGHFSEEHKRKLSESHKGKKKQYDVWNKGKTGIYSEETLEKIRMAHLGKKQSDETIEKRRQKMIGQKRSDETRKKISEAVKKHWDKIKTFNNN